MQRNGRQGGRCLPPLYVVSGSYGSVIQVGQTEGRLANIARSAGSQDEGPNSHAAETLPLKLTRVDQDHPS